jgi:hypothetical protein
MNTELIQRKIKASNEINETSKYDADLLTVNLIKLSSKKIDYRQKKNQLIIKIDGVKKLLNLCQ